MKQYYGVKSKHPDALLLFRVGDFYETFGEDAVTTSEILGIVLARRSNGAAGGVELAGFPHHALDTYLPRLIRSGQRVAICDQLEDPKLTKTIVKRGVTELVTPGVAFNSNIIEIKENNFLACVHQGKDVTGAAFLDISTGEFFVAEGQTDYIDKLLGNFMPKEVLFRKGTEASFGECFGTKHYTYKMDEWAFVPEAAREKLLRQFQLPSLKGFGVEEMPAAQTAAGAILHYLDLTEHRSIAHVSSISRIEEERYVWLDKFTMRNLELLVPQSENAKTLLDIMDKTVSPMGARMLRRWIALPLKEIAPVNERLNAVEFFVENAETRDSMRNEIAGIGDIERIISRTAAGRANPRELVQLKLSLNACARVKQLCLESHSEALRQIGRELEPCREAREMIEREIVADPPPLLSKGGVIGEGVDEELDDLRNLANRSKDMLADIRNREAERTGIASLKVDFNNVFGYYMEVRNTHKDKVPPEWIRKQTLSSAERYITAELKQYEDKILGAEERMAVIEQQAYGRLTAALTAFVAPVRQNAAVAGKLDCLLAFAELAATSNYCKPEVNGGNEIEIAGGRHPVIEKLLPAGEEYVANDLRLDRDSQQIIMITGPNMSGKSALLRQTALTVLMAQIGSFVPAQAARIGIVDKIFTRVGASDNISRGESTFMVEMNETASILNNLSDRSLILLDEIGRGTSTYDGISIARALVEYIHEHPSRRAKTLFATHYHELNEMENIFPRVKNFNVAVKELNNKVVFLRKLMPGGVAHSFGIHVARMAGMPKSVVARAEEILKELERSRERKPSEITLVPTSSIAKEGCQLSFFQLDDPVLIAIRDKLKKLDINNLTPIEALNRLNEIKRITGL
ncbi:MAG: DNA mismatch repair protein MutS [Prevotellaceae bacterium]|jgi:DNA mismatch repair protein MutS|nr:DNA mismatch repair protein MutS [Prevotellaceae bacterium]